MKDKVMAAVPDANTMDRLPFSISVTAASSAFVVGVP
jgi:hypothetical protein